MPYRSGRTKISPQQIRGGWDKSRAGVRSWPKRISACWAVTCTCRPEASNGTKIFPSTACAKVSSFSVSTFSPHVIESSNFSLSLCYTAPSNMSFRGGAKPRRGNLPVQCLFLRYFSIDCTRRLPRRMASSRHAPRNDKLDTFCTLHSAFCISSVSSININLSFPLFL